jgi:hypothetical protein
MGAGYFHRVLSSKKGIGATRKIHAYIPRVHRR